MNTVVSSNMRPFTVADLDAGRNPYLVTGFHDGHELVFPWLAATVALGPTPRVRLLPGQAAEGRFGLLGDLLRQTIANPSWGSSDPDGLSHFRDAVRVAVHKVVSEALDLRCTPTELARLFATLPREAYAHFPYGDARLSRAMRAKCSAAWIGNCVPWMPTAILRRVVVANPTAPWAMRALARLGAATESPG